MLFLKNNNSLNMFLFRKLYGIKKILSYAIPIEGLKTFLIERIKTNREIKEKEEAKELQFKSKEDRKRFWRKRNLGTTRGLIGLGVGGLAGAGAIYGLNYTITKATTGLSPREYNEKVEERIEQARLEYETLFGTNGLADRNKDGKISIGELTDLYSNAGISSKGIDVKQEINWGFYRLWREEPSSFYFALPSIPRTNLINLLKKQN
jgi:hypothetical protein